MNKMIKILFFISLVAAIGAIVVSCRHLVKPVDGPGMERAPAEYASDNADSLKVEVNDSIANKKPEKPVKSKWKRKYFIVVDKGAMQVQLHHEDSGKVKAYRCALGRGLGQKREKGDCRTPEGRFYAGAVYNSADWHYTSPEGVRCPNPGQYGPKFIRVSGSGYSSIGIHGTDCPRSLGRRVSHGCIRVSNNDILDLVAYVEPGMKIIIKPGPRDIYADAHRLNDALTVGSVSKDSIAVEKDTTTVILDSTKTIEI